MSQKADFIKAAKRWGSSPDFDKLARTKYKVSGAALLAKVAKGESGFNMAAVSGAGAKGGTQFMPATRADFLKRFGVDAWKDPDSAVHATKIYIQKSGLAAYNPGMPSYSDYILKQKVGDLKAGKSSSTTTDSGPVMKAGKMTYTDTSTPAVTAPSKEKAVQMVLASGSHKLQHIGTGSRLKQVKYLLDSGQANETTPATVSGTSTAGRSTVTAAARKAGTTAPKGKGAFTISGPNPGRLSKGTVAFAKSVANQLGEALEGMDGSTHSKYTVDGNVSQHWSGHASDIFKINGKPARGERLIKAGQAALIAAGMPEAQARKKRGGLFNVVDKNGVRHQVIFNTQEGGDHTDHLHVSSDD